METFVGLIILLLLGIGVYLLPGICALLAHKRNAGAIMFLNVALGWTFVVWVGCFVWAMVEKKKIDETYAAAPKLPEGFYQ